MCGLGTVPAPLAGMHSGSSKPKSSKPAGGNGLSASVPWLLAPEEWDFRFIDPSEFDVLVAYEYARSCPWVVPLWSRWIAGTIDTPTRGILGVRDELRRLHGTGLRLSANPDPVAKVLLASFPAYLNEASLCELLCATPSFPARWADLPRAEREAALPLVTTKTRPEPFRDAQEPPWPW